MAINLGTGNNFREVECCLPVMAADYIEPDLCLTKDGVFVAMHDLLLDETTNIADFPQFSSRYTTKVVDGANMTGFFVSDFELEELKLLRLKQRITTRSSIFDGFFSIPSFSEITNLVQQQYLATEKLIGIYPELKHPTYHKEVGFAMEDMFLTALESAGYAVTGASVYNNLTEVVPVVVQCFESQSLQYLHTKTTLPLMLLVKYSVNEMNYISEAVLKATSLYASAIGPEKKFFDPIDLTRAQELVTNSHALGLAVHPWTFRADQDILPPFGDNFTAEQLYFYNCLGVDALFTEFPDQTREVVDSLRFRAEKSGCPVL